MSQNYWLSRCEYGNVNPKILEIPCHQQYLLSAVNSMLYKGVKKLAVFQK